MDTIKVAPSLLSADFTKLGDEIQRVEQAGADMLHVDVMDGHYVPNITFGPFIVEAMKRTATVPLSVHLMISDPLKYAGPFARAGADVLTFHREVCDDARAAADEIRTHGTAVGISINPETPVDTLVDVLDHVDEVLIMTVRPGFAGQKFMAENMQKIVELRQRKSVDELDITVDGGINYATAAQAVGAGANILVAGSFVFGSDDVARTITGLRNAGTIERT